MAVATETLHAPKDYKSELKPVWCPGCGDYGVLSALYKAMSMCNLDPEKTVVVSGIGCSSRLPGFVQTYGFHGVHGRALPVATGIKMARPDLNVIVVGGDGDGYSIGGGHLREALLLEILTRSSQIFSIALQMSAPMIAISFVVTLLFSILGRAVPQMNVFTESFSVRTLIGLAVFGLTLNLMAQHLLSFLRHMPEDLMRVARLLGLS